MFLISSSVNQVDQWVCNAASAPGMESKVHWSTALAKAPLKMLSEAIHFSRTSQPPRFTPRRKGIEVPLGAATGVDVSGAVVGDGAVLVLGVMRMLVVVGAIGVLIEDTEVLAAANEVEIEVDVGVSEVEGISRTDVERVGTGTELVAERVKNGIDDEEFECVWFPDLLW
jgi:hypothetical protein